jgi:hypothetical protein
MSDKVCGCQFCKDYKRFKEVLPLVPAEHQGWFEAIFDTLWNTAEDLEYKKAILDGSWPSSVKILEHHLANARAKADARIYATPEQVASAEFDLNFDCKVCEKCSKPMTAKKYWEHKCDPNSGGEYGLTDEALLVSDGDLEDDQVVLDAVLDVVSQASYDKLRSLSSIKDLSHEIAFDEEVEDDAWAGGDHQGDFF